jgi:hypothetical protein
MALGSAMELLRAVRMGLRLTGAGVVSDVAERVQLTWVVAGQAAETFARSATLQTTRTCK